MKKCESGRNKVEIFFLLYDHIIRNKSVRNEAEELVAPLAPPTTVCHLRPENQWPSRSPPATAALASVLLTELPEPHREMEGRSNL